MTSFLQPIPIFGDFRTKYIGQQENIFLMSFSKWHFEYCTASANLFHSIQKKADISTADNSKIWQLTWKRFRLKNNTKLDLGVNHVFKLVDLTSTVLIHNCCQLHLKNKRQVGELIRGQCRGQCTGTLSINFHRIQKGCFLMQTGLQTSRRHWKHISVSALSLQTESIIWTPWQLPQ